MKRVICVFVSVVILVSSICIFAVDEEYYDTPITYHDFNNSDKKPSYNDILVYGTQITTNAYIVSNRPNTYLALYLNRGGYGVTGIYDNTEDSNMMTFSNFGYYGVSQSVSNNSWGYNGTYGKRIMNTDYKISIEDVPFIPVYNSKTEALDAINEFIENGGYQESNTLNYSLPAGNIAIIETNSNYSFLNLSTVMPLQSTSFANNPWPNTTQRIGFYSSLPANLNPSVMGNTISWQKSGNASLFGITTSAEYSESVISKFKYVVISNPYYYPANDMEDSQYTNGNINISMDGVVNITIKNLTATVNTNTGEVENNENGSEWTGTIDSETGGITWTDQDGETTTPTSGGNLSDPSISGFQSWLKGILQSIISIFEPAHDAIQTLSGAVGNFANWLYALYIWLPASILSVLKAAITLSIVIGVIKVFI